MGEKAIYQDLQITSSTDYDYLIKILAIGNASVGKTSLLYHYTEDKPYHKPSATVGVDFKEKRVLREVPASESLLGHRQRIHLQLWDTAGQERFRSLCTVFIREAMGFLVVFDLTNEESLLDCRQWIEVLNTHAYTDKPDVVLVGNKSDLKAERQVTYEEGLRIAHQLGVPYVETSALTGEDVAFAFQTLLDLIMLRIEQSIDKSAILNRVSDGNVQKVQLDKTPPPKQPEPSINPSCGC